MANLEHMRPQLLEDIYNEDETFPPVMSDSLDYSSSGIATQETLSTDAKARRKRVPRQVIRLAQIGKNFDRAVAQLPEETRQRIIDEHRELVGCLRRQDPGSLEGRF